MQRHSDVTIANK